MKILFGLFLIAHALIHLSFVSPQPPVQPGAPAWPFDISKSWLLTGVNPDILRTVGIVLTVVAVVGFVASGLGWLGVSLLKTYWVGITVVSCIFSTLLVVIFWHNWFVMAPVIDLALLYAIYFKNLRP